jgi:hypothetical protein
MRCDEVRGQAGALASLPRVDLERQAALEHARSCPECAAALREGERVLALLDALPPPPPPSPDVLRRASAKIVADLDRAARGSAWSLLAPPAALALGWALLVSLARHLFGEPTAWVESVVVLCLAAGGLFAARQWGPLAVGAIVALSGLLAVYAGASNALSPLLGLKCAALELAAAALPFATTLWVWRREGGWAPLAGAAAAGALAGQAALHLTCEARAAMPHLLAFHFGGVLLASVLGGGLALMREAAARR